MATLGIIGTGRIAGLLDSPTRRGPATTHAQAAFRTAGMRLVSAMNPDRAALHTFARRWKVDHRFASLGKFLARPLPDVVAICSPDRTHFPIARQLLLADVPPRVVFVEKPVCGQLKELRTLIRLAASRRCRVIVNHSRRFDDAHQRMAARVRSGTLGKMLFGRMTYYGGWLHNGVHLVDLCAWLFGPRFTIQRARGLSFGPPRDRCREATLDFGRFRIEVDCIDERCYQLFEGEFRFSAGRLIYRDFGNRIYWEKVRVNASGERELVPAGSDCRQPSRTPLMNAYAAINDYLRRGDAASLRGVLLEDAAVAMERLFDA